MLAVVMPFVILGIFVIGRWMDESGIKRKRESPEDMAEYEARVQTYTDARIAASVKAEAQAILSRERRAVELHAELERARAEGQE